MRPPTRLTARLNGVELISAGPRRRPGRRRGPGCRGGSRPGRGPPGPGMPRGLTPRARPTRAWDAAGAHAPGEAHPGAADGRGARAEATGRPRKERGDWHCQRHRGEDRGASPSVPSLALLLYPHQPRSRERARDPPFSETIGVPPVHFGGADSRGGVGSLDQHRPGMGQAERSDPEAPVPRPWTGLGATTSRGGPVARGLLERAHAEPRKASHDGWPGDGRIASEGVTTSWCLAVLSRMRFSAQVANTGVETNARARGPAGDRPRAGRPPRQDRRLRDRPACEPGTALTGRFWPKPNTRVTRGNVANDISHSGQKAKRKPPNGGGGNEPCPGNGHDFVASDRKAKSSTAYRIVSSCLDAPH